jgi:hypothetical protein
MRDNPAAKEAFFDAIVCAAIEGRRCPNNGTFGVHTTYTSELAREGRIRVEISMHNYRTVIVLTGEHAGKTTLPPPNRIKPWKIIDNTGTWYSGRRLQVSSYSTRSQPSPPQLLKKTL